MNSSAHHQVLHYSSFGLILILAILGGGILATCLLLKYTETQQCLPNGIFLSVLTGDVTPHIVRETEVVSTSQLLTSNQAAVSQFPAWLPEKPAQCSCCSCSSMSKAKLVPYLHRGRWL